MSASRPCLSRVLFSTCHASCTRAVCYLSIFAAAPSRGAAPCCSCPGTLGREADGLPGFLEVTAPCHGKKCSCYLQGVSGGFWLKTLNCQTQREHCVSALSSSCAQVSKGDFIIVTAPAGTAHSLQALASGTAKEGPPPPGPHRLPGPFPPPVP